MNKFLKLHNSDDNGVIVVNKDQINAIVSFYDKNDRLTSKIYLNVECSIAPFIVNETPSIIIKPEEKEFITVHDFETNNVIIIRKTEISIVDTIRINGYNTLKSKIYFCGNTDMTPINVHESAEKLLNNLSENIELEK